MKEDKTVNFYQYVEAFQNNKAREFSATGTCAKVGDELTITVEGEPSVFKILLNDKENLHMYIKDEETYKNMLISQETTLKYKKSKKK